MRSPENVLHVSAAICRVELSYPLHLLPKLFQCNWHAVACFEKGICFVLKRSSAMFRIVRHITLAPSKPEFVPILTPGCEQQDLRIGSKKRMLI